MFLFVICYAFVSVSQKSFIARLVWNALYLGLSKLRLANWYNLTVIIPNDLWFYYNGSIGDNYELKYVYL